MDRRVVIVGILTAGLSPLVSAFAAAGRIKTQADFPTVRAYVAYVQSKPCWDDLQASGLPDDYLPADYRAYTHADWYIEEEWASVRKGLDCNTHS